MVRTGGGSPAYHDQIMIQILYIYIINYPFIQSKKGPDGGADGGRLAGSAHEGHEGSWKPFWDIIGTAQHQRLDA